VFLFILLYSQSNNSINIGGGGGGGGSSSSSSSSSSSIMIKAIPNKDESATAPNTWENTEHFLLKFVTNNEISAVLQWPQFKLIEEHTDSFSASTVKFLLGVSGFVSQNGIHNNPFT
jgi:hypothetical protein